MERSSKKMRTIFAEIVVFLFLLQIRENFADSQFVFNKFTSDNLTLEGPARVTEDGLLQLRDYKNSNDQGSAFYSNPVKLKGNVSFSTTFVIRIESAKLDDKSGHGMAFVISPQNGLPKSLAIEFLGPYNHTNNGNSTSLAYFIDEKFNNLSLDKPIQVWVEYNAEGKKINVTLAPLDGPKPGSPLLTRSQDLSRIFSKTMFVGFSASNKSVQTSQYVLGWSFAIDGEAQPLTLPSLPLYPWPSPSPTPPPYTSPKPSKTKNIAAIVSAVMSSIVILALLVIFGLYYTRKQKSKKVPLLSPSSPTVSDVRKFSYRELEEATSVFGEQIGEGASGTVYRGVLPNSESQVAVKKVSGDAKYRSKEFTAEIENLGKLRHQNLVFLHGYCEHEGQLLLVYDYMPNGSVDMFLYPKRNPLYCTFIWSQRFQIVKDVANGLYYLHKGLKQVVIHRDIKSSNVLLDDKMNARLGDFGLAKLHDQGADAASTSKVVGYMAPEMQYGMSSTQTDVYAFGAFLLEIACGRRPHLVSERGLHLVDWVSSSMKEDAILNTADKRLEGEYVKEEMILVLKLGLLCCRFQPTARPTIQKIIQYLNGDAAEADLRALNTVDEAPVRYVGGGSTPPRSGTQDIFLE